MSVSPMVLHVYNNENEVVKTATRTFIPFGIMREAVKLQVLLHKDENDLAEADVDALENFVLRFYEGHLEQSDLKNIDLFELMTVLQSVFTAVNGGTPKNAIAPGI